MRGLVSINPKDGLEAIAEKVYAGERLSREDGLALYASNDLLTIGELANYACEKKSGKDVYFISNRHINPTNICVNLCNLCAYGKEKDAPGAYTMDLEEVLRRASEGDPQSITEFHLVGGLHPELPFEYYLTLLRELKARYPKAHLQAFTAVEIDYFTRISGLSLEKVLSLLVDAGLGSLPGGGAEVFDPEVRRQICPKKISGDRWLEVMEVAHSLGLKSNATMLYGHIEGPEHRIDHMLQLRKFQDRTGGFQSFIPLVFHSKNTKFPHLPPTTGFDDLKTLAIGRLMLDNFPHIKAFWIMLGPKIAQVSLHFGVDDIDGTVLEERITHAAGATTGQALTKAELIAMIKKAGKNPVERDTLYNVVQRY